MKRKVLCVLVLVVCLLICLTLLATKIEDEMKPLVKTAQRIYNRKLAAELHMTDKALFQDAEGSHLFEVREGAAWETGLRAYEVTGWTYGDRDVSFYGKRNYTLIEAASRQPREGELVKLVDALQPTDDVYLYLFDRPLPQEIELPENSSLLGRTEQALLLSMTDAASPFMAQTARGLSDSTRQATEVFSLKDVKAFLEMLPQVVLIPVLLLVGLMLWLVSCILSRNAEKHKLLLCVNAALGAGMLLGLALLLRQIDLPASLLPEENILDMQHWQDVLQTFFDALKPFSAEAMELENAYASALHGSLGMLHAGYLGCIALVVIEWLAARLHTAK